MIAIIDYGMGNLRSVQKGFEKVGFDAVVTADPKVLLDAERVVLPGVGAFRDCMKNLEEGGFVEPILRVMEPAGNPERIEELGRGVDHEEIAVEMHRAGAPGGSVRVALQALGRKEALLFLKKKKQKNFQPLDP